VGSLGTNNVLGVAKCQRRPDITLARQLLGWKPEVTLDEGLARTVEWFKVG
jgi:nucleoside-diphosphate-sugar epimerase